MATTGRQLMEILTSLSPGQIVGLLSAATALVGAWVALSKRRPEVAQVLVTSASEIVVMQRDALAAAVRAAENAQERMERMETRQAAQDEVIGELRAEIRRLSEARAEAHRELREAEEKVARLTDRVELLEEQLRRHDIPIPPHD